MSTAKERLAARVEEMTESEALEALAKLDGDELTEEQRRGIIDAMDAMDRGEGIPHEQVMAKLRERFPGERKRAAGG